MRAANGPSDAETPIDNGKGKERPFPMAPARENGRGGHRHPWSSPPGPVLPRRRRGPAAHGVDRPDRRLRCAALRAGGRADVDVGGLRDGTATLRALLATLRF